MSPADLLIALLTTWRVRLSTLLAIVVAIGFAAAAMALAFTTLIVVLVALLR